jgi:hypothetical protein
MLTKNLMYNLLFWVSPNSGDPRSRTNSGSRKWRGEFTLKVSCLLSKYPKILQYIFQCNFLCACKKSATFPDPIFTKLPNV